MEACKYPTRIRIPKKFIKIGIYKIYKTGLIYYLLTITSQITPLDIILKPTTKSIMKPII